MPILTGDEIEHLLTRAGLVHLATNGADGYPHLVPLAYLYRDQRILLTARAKVSWLANIRRDQRVCLTVDQGRYPLRKVTVRGLAEIVYEPGRDDDWRDLRLPLADESTTAPAADVPGQEWSYDAAYRLITADEPRALVAIPLDRSTVTSWRLPLEGEMVAESWASRYYENEPRRFRVVRAGRHIGDVRVVAE